MYSTSITRVQRGIALNTYIHTHTLKLRLFLHVITCFFIWGGFLGVNASMHAFGFPTVTISVHTGGGGDGCIVGARRRTQSHVLYVHHGTCITTQAAKISDSVTASVKRSKNNPPLHFFITN